MVGGSGLIGTKLVAKLRELGHDVVAASPASGVDAVTGAGLSQAVSGARVVIDVSNSPSFEDSAVLEFFDMSGRHLRAAELAAGVVHHVALSVVGTDRLQASGYFRGKLAQEAIVQGSGVPFTILRSTQFFEFARGLVHSAGGGPVLRLPTALMQPVASDDVVSALADIAAGPPMNDIVELAGPEAMRLDEFVRRFLSATGDDRTVVADVSALYFGAPIDDRSLMPDAKARIGSTSFADWIASA